MQCYASSFRGFTVLEVLIVLTLTTVCVSSVALVGTDTYERYLARNDADTALDTLLQARAAAMEQMDTSGQSSRTATVAGEHVSFSDRSGLVDLPVTIAFPEAGAATKTITINTEGGIDTP